MGINKRTPQLWLLGILFLGLTFASRLQSESEPAQSSSSNIYPPLLTVSMDENAPLASRLTPEEQRQAISEAMNYMWQRVPDLESHRLEPMQVQAENGLIAYVGTDGYLYLLNPDGSVQMSLVTDIENIANLDWSPGEEELAFVGDGPDSRCLYRLQISDRNRATLVCGFQAIWEPRWSQDGSYLTFWGQQVADEASHSWVVPAGGGAVVRLGPDLLKAITPDWLDDDTVVLAGEGTTDVWYIYRVDVSAPDQPTPITPAITPDCLGTFAAYPVLSPDDSQVAYIGARSEGGKNSTTCYYSIYLVDPAGQTTPALIVDVADTSQTGNAGISEMRWAADNQRLGLLSSSSDNVLRLNVVNTADGQVNVLHGREGGSWWGWDWSPDDTLMAAGYLPPDGEWELDKVSPEPASVGTFAFLAQGRGPAWSSRPLPSPVDLQVTGLEVTQATQSPQNTVPLVQGKTTWVRVFVQSSPVDVNGVTARLFISQDGREQIVRPVNRQIIVRTDGGNRDELNHTFNFLLPIDWTTNAIQIRAEVGPGNQFYELNYDNNVFPPALQPPETLNFEATSVITVYSYRFRFIDPDGTEHVVSHAEAESMMPFTRWTYPIADNGLPSLVDKGEIRVNTNDFNLRTEAGWAALISKLGCNALVNNQERCIGWIPPTVQPVPNPYWGYAISPAVVSNISHGRWVMDGLVAHELGHTFRGSGHPDCAYIGNYGFHGTEESQQVYIPTRYFNFMNPSTVCGMLTDSQWVSSNEYLTIKNRLTPTNNVLFAPGDIDSVQPYLRVAGVITPGLEAEFRSLYTITRTVGFDDGLGSGPFRIDLLNTSGQVLFSRYVSGGSPSEGGLEESIYFHEVMPRPAGIIKVAIWDGTVKLAELSASPHIPQVQFLTPLDGLTLDGETTIEWTASDNDSDSLLYLVEYSADGGQSWEILAINSQDSTFTFDANYLQGTTQGKIRVLASDGLNSGAALSDGYFTVGIHAPHVSIMAPQDGARVVPGIVINLVGSAYDLEDGLLPDDALSWILDDDTSPGTGGLISIEDLEYGSHVISLTATDSDGQSSTTSITVTITDYPHQIYLPIIHRGQ